MDSDSDSLKLKFWSTFVQKSSNVSAPVLISADLCRMSQLLCSFPMQLPCSFLLICVQCLSSRAQASAQVEAQAQAQCNGDGANLEFPRATVPLQVQNLASFALRQSVTPCLRVSVQSGSLSA